MSGNASEYTRRAVVVSYLAGRSGGNTDYEGNTRIAPTNDTHLPYNPAAGETPPTSPPSTKKTPTSKPPSSPQPSQLIFAVVLLLVAALAIGSFVWVRDEKIELDTAHAEQH